MALTGLQVSAVRNLRDVRLEHLSQVNVFYGANGSGKTSLLEAIHLLGMARSFRGSSIKSLIAHGQPSCTVFGQSDDPLLRNLGLGVQRMRDGDAQIKVGGEQVRTVAQLANYLPLQVISADSFSLLIGPPGARRQFLDWGVFHVEHDFFAEWQRFQRCIKQRNHLLRRGKLKPDELAVWTRDLVKTGEAINTFRKAYFERLTPRFMETLSRLAPSLNAVELRFRQGWDAERTYEQALDQGLAVDFEGGYTRAGPQRADIRVLVDGHSAADTLSRGQQKLVVCALKLAQGQLMGEAGEGCCTYLIDDLPSELDRNHGELVCQLLATMDTQVFITCVERQEIESVWPTNEDKRLAMFHVEHGGVTPLV